MGYHTRHDGLTHLNNSYHIRVEHLAELLQGLFDDRSYSRQPSVVYQHIDAALNCKNIFDSCLDAFLRGHVELFTLQARSSQLFEGGHLPRRSDHGVARCMQFQSQSPPDSTATACNLQSRRWVQKGS